MPNVDRQDEILEALGRIEAILTALFNTANKSGQSMASPPRPIVGGHCAHLVSLATECEECKRENSVR